MLQLRMPNWGLEVTQTVMGQMCAKNRLNTVDRWGERGKRSSQRIFHQHVLLVMAMLQRRFRRTPALSGKMMQVIPLISTLLKASWWTRGRLKRAVPFLMKADQSLVTLMAKSLKTVLQVC